MDEHAQLRLAHQIVILTEAMREAQRNYRKVSDSTITQIMYGLEERVDLALVEYNNKAASGWPKEQHDVSNDG